MAFLSTKNYVSSLQKRRNSSPSRIQHSVVPERYQLIGGRSKDLPFGKKHHILHSPHSTLITSFDDKVFSLQQEYPRPTRLPPIVHIQAERKEKKGQLSQKKKPLKKSSKVHAQNTEKVVDVQGTSEIPARKSVQRKTQVKAGGEPFNAFLEKGKIYQNKKDRNKKSFERQWEANEDSEEDVFQEESDLSYFQNKEIPGLIRKKSSQCPGQENLKVSHRLKAYEGLKLPSREISSAPASSLQKRPSEFKQTKLPPIASANEYHVKRECDSYGSTRRHVQDSPDFTTSELCRPLQRRPRTCDSQFSNLHLQRNLPVLPKNKQKPSVQFPSLLKDEIREGTPEQHIPHTIRSEWDENKNSSSRSEYNSGGVERESDLERERRRIQRLCSPQNNLRRDSFEKESYPVRYEASQCLYSSFVDVTEHKDSKGTRLPELEPRQQSMRFFRKLPTTHRVRQISSAPQKSTSTTMTNLSCRKSSRAPRCSGTSQATLDAEERTARSHRESIQKLDVYEFLQEEYETTASMEQPTNSALSKDAKKAMRDIFQFLKRL